MALTRAQIRTARGLQARATAVGKVVVSAKAAKFCRRGRVILVLRVGPTNYGVSVILWPTFRRLMKLDTAKLYSLVTVGKFPPFLGNREYRELLLELRRME